MLILAGVCTGIYLTSDQPAPPYYADRVRAGFVACSSGYLLEQYELATHRMQVGMMTRDQCLPTERLTDYPFVVLESGPVSMVRLAVDSKHYSDVYLPIEAIRHVSEH